MMKGERSLEEPAPLEATRHLLCAELITEMSRGATAVWSQDRFDDLALRVFRYQALANPVYRALTTSRGLDPSRVSDWREIPPVPTRAFKELSLACSSPNPPQALFRTSGTSEGGMQRGAHPVRDLTLYRASLLGAGSSYLRPELDGPSGSLQIEIAHEPLRVLALLPEPARCPDSSLAHMAGVFAEEWDDGGGGFFADKQWNLDVDGFASALSAARDDDVAVFLLGTAFAFVHWLDRRETSRPAPLPSGSRLMETGGFKGRSREVPRGELYAALGRTLGLPPERMVNEYGMTELLSQFYGPVLREGGPGDLRERRHVPPPWVRTRVLDPESLVPVEPGEVGLLCHLDLANLDSVSAILTEDLGVAVPNGLRILGRAPGAEPRGCSLAMEEILELEEDAT